MKQSPVCYLSYIASAITPAIFAIFLVQNYFHTSILSFVPIWNDEIDYWHEILSFAKNGFSIGYYTIEEIPSPLSSATHFGTHGPLFPMLYGSVAKFAGWIPSSGPLFNLCFLSIAITIFLLLIRANLYTTLLATIIFASFVPIQIYLPSTMQEPVHFTIAMVLAGQFYRYMADEKRSEWLLISIPILITIASLLRPTWSVLFTPYLLLTFKKHSKEKVRVWITGAVTFGIFLYGFTLCSAPYPDNFANNLLVTFNSSPTDAVKNFASHFTSNLVSYLSLQNPFSVENSLRLQLIVLAVFGAIIYPRLQKTEDIRFESTVHTCNLIAPLAIVISLYDIGDWRDFRVMAPHILFSLSLLLAQRTTFRISLFLWAIFFTISLFSISSFTENYKKFHGDHFLNRDRNIVLFQDEIFSVLKYKKDASPWGNSLLMDIDSLQATCISIPAGIGINIVSDWKRIRYPLKSAYIFIQPKIYMEISDKVHLQPIASSARGFLYLNLDSPAY